MYVWCKAVIKTVCSCSGVNIIVCTLLTSLNFCKRSTLLAAWGSCLHCLYIMTMIHVLYMWYASVHVATHTLVKYIFLTAVTLTILQKIHENNPGCHGSIPYSLWYILWLGWFNENSDFCQNSLFLPTSIFFPLSHLTTESALLGFFGMFLIHCAIMKPCGHYAFSYLFPVCFNVSFQTICITGTCSSSLPEEDTQSPLM